jgi:hypothetical protein
MVWNHRVVKSIVAGEEVFAIHEVHYETDDDGVPGEIKYITELPTGPYGSSVTELSVEISRMLDACKKEVVNYDDI